MKTKKGIKSKPKLSTILILNIGGILAIIFGTAFIINGKSNLAVLIIGSPFLALGIYSLYWVYNFDILHITDEKLIFKSVTGYTKKTILLSEFISYAEIEKENVNRDIKWKDLTLIGHDFKYKISSTSYSNYSELRKTLIKGLKRNSASEKEWKRRNELKFGYGFILFGILFSLFFGNIMDSKTDIIPIILLLGFFIFLIGYGIRLVRKNKNTSR